MLYAHLPYPNDSKIVKTEAHRKTLEVTIKMQEGRRKKTFLEKYSPLTLLQGFERVVQWFACERVLETELHILTPLLWPSRCVFLVLLMLGSTPSGLPRAPSVGCGFPYHISSLTLWKPAGNSIGGFRGSPRSGVAFPTTSGLYCQEFYWQLLWHPTQLNYIIIQRPHDRPLDVWNRMFNRHQAVITVIQFRGYSLPVHHCSGTIGPSPCPIS